MLNCAENAFVDATPISGPAAIDKTKSDSLEILLSVTLTRLNILLLFSLAYLKAASVSAVSPDCEIKIERILLDFYTMGLYRNSEAKWAEQLTPAIFSNQ